MTTPATLTLSDTAVKRIRFAATTSLVFAAATIAAIPLEAIDAAREGFDPFIAIPLAFQLAFAVLVGRTGLALHRLASTRQRLDLRDALLSLRIYFTVHGLFFVLLAALAVAGSWLAFVPG